MQIQNLLKQLSGSAMADWAPSLEQAAEHWLEDSRHGDLARWKQAVQELPRLPADRVALDQPAVTVCAESVSAGDARRLREGLQQLHPWRKGPFHVHGQRIDTEWRSDLKWARVQGALDEMRGRRVLDIGCGNGYFGWRMLGAGAEWVIGIDPTLLFVMQHQAIQHFLHHPGNWVLPLGIEDLPATLSGFDSVFSMGVLYHRRSPIHHLDRLHALLRPGGQLLLETLVVEGSDSSVLVPEGRYARMRNVWFIPSTGQLECWLRRCRFIDVGTVDVTATTSQEQRSTEWMRFESLSQCLDPDNPTRTVEGHPAPLRAVLSARRPR